MKRQYLLLGILTILTVFFNLFIFPFFTEKTGGHKLLDTHFFYKPEEALVLLEQLGSEGRKWYLWMAGMADMVYPLIYGSLFVSLARMIKYDKWLMGVALAAPLADVCENLATVYMLLKYPLLNQHIALIGSFFNGLKWMSVLAFIVLLFSNAIGKWRMHSRNDNEPMGIS